MLWKGIVALPACKYWSCHKSYIWVQQGKPFQIKMSIKRWAFDDQNPPWIDNKEKQPPEVFYKKIFVRISQNSQENTYAKVFLQATGLQLD